MRGRAKELAVRLLFFIALALTVFFAIQTARAIIGFQHSHQAAQSGNVQTIRSWMTLPYIARVYHVPESYLLESVGLAETDAPSVRHMTIAALATRLGTTSDALIHEIQQAILTYRQEQPSPTPSATPYSALAPPGSGVR